MSDEFTEKLAKSFYASFVALRMGLTHAGAMRTYVANMNNEHVGSFWLGLAETAISVDNARNEVLLAALKPSEKKK